MRAYLLSVLAALLFGFGVLTFYNSSYINAHGSAFAAGGLSIDLGSVVKTRHVETPDQKELRLNIAQDSNYLLNTQGQDILSLLKDPELVRRELPATTWQYRSDKCVLDLYFMSQQGSVHATPVVHFETRSRDAHATLQDPTATQSCVNEIIDQRLNLRMVSVDTFSKVR